jgi:serine protease Do
MSMNIMKKLLFAKANNLVVIMLSIALGGALATNWSRPNRLYAIDAPATSAAQKATLREIEDGFATIAEKVEPSVVTIEARSMPKASDNENQPRTRRRAPQGDDENSPFGGVPFPDIFRRFEMPDPDTMPGTARGSGVIVRLNGRTAYVLTNYHVVQNREKFSVTLFDKTQRPATLVGQDQKTDLAVVKFDAPQSLPERYVAQLGDSNRVRVGQWAIAIGSPLEYEETLTVGVISAKGRTLTGGSRTYSTYNDLIQTDAAINPGNSGGPLVNIDGDVVGINVAIASTLGSQGNIGIGFAIPVNTAKEVLGQLIERGKVTRGWLGITNTNPELSSALKADFGVQDGALVDDVVPGSPADKAGLKPGDVITRFDGEPIHTFRDLERMVGQTRPNTRVTLAIVRDRRPMTLPLTLEERAPEDQLLAQRGGRRGERPEPGQPSSYEDRKFGLSVQPASEGRVRGVEVVAVAPGSPAEDANIQAGDIIQRIGRTDVTDVASFRRALEGLRTDDEVVVRVYNQAASTNRFTTMRVP